MVPLKKYRAAILDKDGVIFDSEEVHYAVRRDLLKSHGVELTREMYAKHMMSRNYREAFPAVCTPAQLPEYEYQDMYARIQAEYKRRSKTELRVVPGVHGLINRLAARGLLLAVASTQPRETILSELQTLGETGEHFRVIVSGQDVKHNKPQPDVYLAAAEKLKVKPKDCFALEDSVSGVQAAVAAGICCIGRSSRWTSWAALVNAGARHVISNYECLG